MPSGTGDYGLDSLPEILPLFPLSGALLLPHGHLPLNIFEPRYLNMVEDALGQGRLIGMVQPKKPATDPVPEDTLLYPVGCSGRIVSFEETETGHLFIALRGLCRFQITEEVAGTGGYRRARVDYTPYNRDVQEDTGRVQDRARLLKAVRSFFEIKGLEVDWSALEEAADESLVTSLSMICPLESSEKQALLEAPGVGSRGELLTSLLEMSLMGEDETGGPFRH